jgi:processive 1,2-diacylglycerol beta-glucosyltransferase
MDRGQDVTLLNAFEYAPRWFADLYMGAHLAGQGSIPNFYGAAYQQANRRGGLFEPLRQGFDELTFERLIRAVCNERSDSVIVTHHLPLVGLARARAKGQLVCPLTCVVTDYTAHAVWAEPHVDVFAVANARVEQELRAHGVHGRIVQTGIPVKPEFEQVKLLSSESMPHVSASARIDNASDRGAEMRVLITIGGFSVGPLGAILRSFAGIKDVHMTVVCGRNQNAEAMARRVTEQHGLNAEIIGFESNMAARMRDAHLVIGKAGGLTVSEAMTAARPMVLVGTVPGNETANEVLVRESGAGVAAKAREVGRIASDLRSLLLTMSHNARASVTLGAAGSVLDNAKNLAMRAAV